MSQVFPPPTLLRGILTHRLDLGVEFVDTYARQTPEDRSPLPFDTRTYARSEALLREALEDQLRRGPLRVTLDLEADVNAVFRAAVQVMPSEGIADAAGIYMVPKSMLWVLRVIVLTTAPGLPRGELVCVSTQLAYGTTDLATVALRVQRGLRDIVDSYAADLTAAHLVSPLASANPASA